MFKVLIHMGIIVVSAIFDQFITLTSWDWRANPS